MSGERSEYEAYRCLYCPKCNAWWTPAEAHYNEDTDTHECPVCQTAIEEL